MGTLTRKEARDKRHLRVRKKVSGTAERPRLVVFKSNKHIYAQIIDDNAATTLVSFDTNNAANKSAMTTSNIEAAKLVGKKVAEKGLKKGISSVVFDRGGYIYHGRVKALAEAARDSGLKF